MGRRWWPALMLALAASLALNVHLWRQRGGGAAPASGVDGGAPGDAPCAPCQRRLARCRAADRTLPAELLRLGLGLGPAGAPAPTEARLAELMQADAELQQSVLCEVARRHLRQHWRTREASITADLRRSVGDRDKMGRDLRRTAEEVASLLELSDARREGFLARYAPLRQRRVAAVAGLLAQDPVPYRQVHAQVQGLYADEDRLVGGLYGDAARRRLRASQAELRTTILAILATLADLPWEVALGW